MPRVEFAPEVMDDLDRIVGHLTDHGGLAIAQRIQELIDAIGILERHPLIGRPSGQERRELVIGRDSRGYVALYKYIPALDTVYLLAIRSQREAGYSDR